MYRYFIGFNCLRGFGTSEMSFRKPIESSQDLQDVQQFLRDQNQDTSIVVISVFRLVK